MNNSSNNTITFDKFDKLKLKPFAENLFQIIEKGLASSIWDMGQKGNYSISLNAQFGNGKTAFLHMFKHFIETKKSHHNVLFINAWESDFSNEPVIAILSEFVNWLNDKKGPKHLEKNIKAIAAKIIPVLTILGNPIIQNTTGFNIKGIIKGIKNILTNQNSNIGQNIIANFKQRKKSIQDIKKYISEYIKATKKPLLIIVDELDRARPDYAVHFLEDMKHFFNIEDVVFLAAVNKQQMEATVKCLYGQELDFNGYYRKFFKHEIDLPDIYKQAARVINTLVQKTNVQCKQNPEDRIESIYLACRMFNLTLREIEHYIRIFEYILGSNSSQSVSGPSMDCYSFFICLFMKEQEVFKQILSKKFGVNSFIEFINKKNIDFKIPPSPDGSYRINTSDITYSNQCLLATVACFFLEANKEPQKDIAAIQRSFPRVSGVLEPLINRLRAFRQQPAVKICNRINQCKSAFSIN